MGRNLSVQMITFRTKHYKGTLDKACKVIRAQNSDSSTLDPVSVAAQDGFTKRRPTLDTYWTPESWLLRSPISCVMIPSGASTSAGREYSDGLHREDYAAMTGTAIVVTRYSFANLDDAKRVPEESFRRDHA